MGASPLVSKDEIRLALKTWRGNVADSSRALGISETALRKRMVGMGIGTQALSFLRATTVHTQPQPTITKPNLPNHDGKAKLAAEHPQRRNGGRNYSGRDEAPKLEPMQTAADEIPIARRAQTKPPKLRPDQVDQLRDAKFDFMAKHRREADEGDILQKLFDDTFAEWRKRELAGKGK